MVDQILFIQEFILSACGWEFFFILQHLLAYTCTCNIGYLAFPIKQLFCVEVLQDSGVLLDLVDFGT